MTRWSPIRLPQVRERTVKRLLDPSAHVRKLSPVSADWFTFAAHQAALSGLYWVGPDMAALASHAAETLTEATWDQASRPSAHGLMVFAGGIGGLQQVGSMFKVERRTTATPFGVVEQATLDVRAPTEAVSWGPSPGGIQITGWLRWETVVQALEASGADGSAALNDPAPLLPVFSTDIPADGTAIPAEDIRNPHRSIVMTLAASWLLMEQPILAERQFLRPPAGMGGARKRKAEPDVTLIDLRRLYRPSEQPEARMEPSRRYRYRWVVSGHWKNQAYGPDHSLRRRQWQPSYVKGPDGAPLLSTEKVNVWRR